MTSKVLITNWERTGDGGLSFAANVIFPSEVMDELESEASRKGQTVEELIEGKLKAKFAKEFTETS